MSGEANALVGADHLGECICDGPAINLLCSDYSPACHRSDPRDAEIARLREVLEQIEAWEVDWSMGTAANISMVIEFARVTLAKQEPKV